MKVLILSIEFPPGPGGLGTYAYQTASHLLQLGCQVVVATHQTHAPQDDIVEFNYHQVFPIYPLPFRGPIFIEAVERLVITMRAIRKHHPDLLIAFGRQAVWLGPCATQISKIPLIATGTGSEFLPREFHWVYLTRWAYRKVRKVIFISQFTQKLAANYGFQFTDSAIIPLGADDRLYHPGLPVDQLREKLNLLGKRIILTVGQVSQRKAQDIVLRAMPEILKRVPDAVYLIAGLPSLQQPFQALAAELGVTEQVRFLGVVDQEDLPLYYNLAEVFVLVSRQSGADEVEGFGIVVVEAALCGIPAVVADHSGLIEAILPDQTGLVVPQESPSATAEALLRLLMDEPLRNSMGQAARQYALEHATWGKRTSEFYKILQAVQESF